MADRNRQPTVRQGDRKIGIVRRAGRLDFGRTGAIRLQELTNKQLADRLSRDPGTVLYHVRQLTAAGLLEPAPVRSGGSGALEKPYRSTGTTWWLDGPLAGAEPGAAFAPIEAFQDELREAGPGSVEAFERFMLHLSPEDTAELDRRILAILAEYADTDDQRLGQPALGGIFVLHRLKR